MYELPEYADMIADKGRTSMYASAIEARITPSSVVLDLGSGPGLFALIACRAGARKVYAVEAGDVIQVAREAAHAGGFADRIEFIQALSTDLDLPERVDGIVADINGAMPMFGTSLVSILDARARFLKPGGWLVPMRQTLWAAPLTSPASYKRIVEAWTTDYGLDFTAASVRTANSFCRRVLSRDELLAAPQCWGVLEYDRLDGPNVIGEVSWTVDRPALGHGIGVWFDTEAAPGLNLSNSPESGEQHVYGQVFLSWPAAVPLSPRDGISVRLRADFTGDQYVWGWDTRVIDGLSGKEKASSRWDPLESTCRHASLSIL